MDEFSDGHAIYNTNTEGGMMVCDKCGVDLPESVFWDDECLMCHSETKIKQLEAENKVFLETKTALTQQVMDLTVKNQKLREAIETAETEIFEFDDPHLKRKMQLIEENIRLKADFKLVEKLRDEAISDLYKEQAENHRLREAIKYTLRYLYDVPLKKYLQKALKEC